MKKTLFSLAVLASISSLNLFAAAENEIAELKAQIAELQQKTDALIEETTDIKSGSFSYTQVDAKKSVQGMGDGASKIYYSKSPLSIGGYGEMYYANPDKGDAKTDLYRFVPYIGYKFSDNIILNTELEFEHGNQVAVEFMYLDFLINDIFNIRLGHLLVPMGLVNIRHEPTLFNTVQRPEVEKYLLPSTWHESGVMAYGKIFDTGLEYSVGFVNALDLNNSNNTAASTKRNEWIRSGRIKGSGVMNSVAGVARLDYKGINGLLVGTSGYYGDASQGDPSGVSAFIYDLHATYENSGFKFKGLYSATSIVSGAAKWNEPTAAKAAQGYYVNAEYNLLASTEIQMQLPVFVQYESYDPTKETAEGIALNNEVSITTLGANYFPDEQVVLKLDYAMKNYAHASKTDSKTMSFSLGFIF